ncbi:hypothetical protein HUG17_3216 [Dermatophagoides farinae]|uniref:Uncharacterized protein n=1 Tax=Dermatophagoides farinae TaxID=6954 RepID=A0A9D4NVM7_DERFA|nr:putative uncharacterized protein DDB_G0290989 [Dermatophagoides farinae]KAH7639183.1 hypothetical protein HUG17_3216 [Dermatophagoides farinae]
MNTNTVNSSNNNPIVNDVEDIKTVTYFQNQPIQQQWFMVVSHGRIPMFNAPEQRCRRQSELKSIAKSVQMDMDRRKLMMKITNNDNDEQHSLELKFYSPQDYRFEYSIDCRRMDIFRRSKKDRTYFYFTLECPDTSTPISVVNLSNQQQQKLKQQQDRQFQYECHMYHAISISNAEFIADLMDKQVQLNLKNQKNFQRSTIVDKRKKMSKKMNKDDDNTNNENNVINLAKNLSVVLPEIENVRSCSSTSIEQSHPLDRSLDEVMLAMHHVPSLLDLELSSKTTIGTNNNNNVQFDLAYSDCSEPQQKPSSSNNPFLSIVNSLPIATSNWNNVLNINVNEPVSSLSTTTKSMSILSNGNSQSTISLPKLLMVKNDISKNELQKSSPLDNHNSIFDDDFDTFISNRITNELMKTNQNQSATTTTKNK